MPSSASSDSGTSSPRGPKGGGTLKTCAVCIEDYRCARSTAACGQRHRCIRCCPKHDMGCLSQCLHVHQVAHHLNVMPRHSCHVAGSMATINVAILCQALCWSCRFIRSHMALSSPLHVTLCTALLD